MMTGEMKEINYLIPEVDYTTGYNTPYLEGDGMQHLDGTQAILEHRLRTSARRSHERRGRRCQHEEPRTEYRMVYDNIYHFGRNKDCNDGIQRRFNLSENTGRKYNNRKIRGKCYKGNRP